MSNRQDDALPVLWESAGDWTDDQEEASFWQGDPTRIVTPLVRLSDAQSAIASLQAENAALRTVMVAAAEEIQAHWDAHCDAEGYGPANLMRRLEEGIPADYGYTAGAFASLQARLDAAEKDAARWKWFRHADQAQLEFVCRFADSDGNMPEGDDFDAAVDAAMARTWTPLEPA